MTIDDNKYKEAWAAKDGLPDGVYIGDIQKVEFKTNEKQDDSFVFQGIVTEGPHKGTTFYSSLMTYHHEKGGMKMNLAKLAEIAMVLGASVEVTKAFSTTCDYLLKTLKAKSVSIEANTSEYNGKKYTNYSIVNIIGPATQAYADPDAVPTVTPNPDDIPF